MSQSNAREAMQRAKRDYPEYTWEMESGFSTGEFMLHGHHKEGSSRNIVPVLPQKETSGSLRREIDELRVEVARLLSESEKTKHAAEKLAERIKRIERRNEDMGKDYIIELTPPTTEDIRKARPLATVLPQDALTHAMLIAATDFVQLEKMIALCRKAGTQSLPNVLETGGLG